MLMENFAPMMFGGLVLVMLIGFPVAFSVSALGMAWGLCARAPIVGSRQSWFDTDFPLRGLLQPAI